MRILTVVADLGIGGTQRVAQNYAVGLKRHGLASALLAHSGGGPREQFVRDADVELFVGGKSEGLPAQLEAAKRWRPDVVHIHRSGYPNDRESRLLGALKAHGGKVVETNIFARFDWTEGGALIDAHLLLNRWCLFKWRAWGGRRAAAKFATVIPNAIDADAMRRLPQTERQAFRAELGIPAGRFMFGRVGQPLRPKWSPSALTAFSTVVHRGQDVGLLLVGAPDDIIRTAKALPANVQDRIVIRPPTASDSQLAGYFSSMDGFLHTARIGESFGMVLCEAMLCGVPVVTLSTPLKDNGQLEVVGHNRGGIVALNVAALPDAMVQLMQDADLRAEVERTGRDWVMGRFGLDTVVGELIDTYRTVLAGGKPAAAPPDRKWLKTIASLGVGRQPSATTELAFSTLHRPAVYQSYLTLRRLLQRV